jgi:DNA-binding transcriptional LysR family regulator
MARANHEVIADSFSLRQLRLFESVGRLNSVRRGSEECNLSQPAVTQALAKLESLLGHPLLDRRACGSYLTDEGAILHRRTERMLSQVADALLELEVPGGRVGAATISQRLSRSQIRCLLAIIDQGSFAGAALQLGLTQASLQRAARDLENNLRKAIFYRSAAGMLVAPEGLEFGRRLRLALQEIEWAVQEIQDSFGAGESRIVIGALPFGGSVLLAAVLEEFIASHPNADITIINESATEMMKRLRSGEVDVVIGLTQDTSGDDLVNSGMVETPYAVVARRGHPLARKGAVTLEDLIGQDWVVGTSGANRRTCFEALFGNGQRPRTQIATCALPVIRNLLANSDRLTLMTSYELLHEDLLVRLPFTVTGPAPSIGIVTRSNWQPTRLHADFIELVKQRVRNATAPVPVRRAS